MAPETARAALEPLWLAIVELAEDGNDRIIASHRRRSSRQARDIGTISVERASLTHAAAVLARRSDAKS